ncbi:uncharacterized protein LOC111917153 [Lactuca sativa]|uniref:uncharacterized protein LOC111917153 n=1 Tax=Lactuca sativa TaxID=4236 RepID=UPI000CD97B94|nr:uncharacterized protein LOC111917153 [Lactuca sativa]
MASFNLNSMISFSHLLGSSTKIPMLIPEYYDQWADRMQDYLNGLDEELWNCISGNNNPPSNVQPIGSSFGNSEVENQTDRLKKLEKMCVRELRGALPPVVYNYVRGCTTAKEIWNNLKEKFQGTEKTKVNSVKQCLVELKDFRKKDSETIKVYYDRLNEMFYRCNRYGITRSAMEFNLIFVMGLRKEWRSVSMMTHESEVNKIDEESKANLGGPLALVSKISEKEAEKDASDEDKGFIMNSDDEAIAIYSNNRVKKFFKKHFNPKAKSSETKGNFLSKSIGEEKKKDEMKDTKPVEGKTEKKLKGDAGIDCHYCNGANHLANDCMLRKKDERKNKVKDEAYYAEKLEMVRAKAKNLSLVAKGANEDEEGTYQIWSSRSDDEEMRNPTHGAMFAKMEEESEEEAYEVHGRCFVSKSADKSPMTPKVRNILESFNIPVHAYNSELVSFDETVTYFDSIVVFASNEAKKLSMQLLKTLKKLDSKITKIDCLELQITNIMVDRDNFSSDNKLLLAAEEHLLYGIVKVDECLDSEDLVNILSVVNVASTSKGKEKVKDLMVENEIDIPSTSKVCDMNFVDLKDYQTDDSDDEDVEKVLKEKASLKEEEIPRIVVDQVYGDTQKFEKMMNEKGEHYLETNTVVYRNFKSSVDVIFPNQVFVTTKNVENIKPELKKMVEEDNTKTTEEGFFANQNTVENNLTKNSYVFQREKPQKQWVEKSKVEKEKIIHVEKENENVVKLNSKEFKDQIDKFSKENNISKR